MKMTCYPNSLDAPRCAFIKSENQKKQMEPELILPVDFSSFIEIFAPKSSMRFVKVKSFTGLR